MKKKPGNEIKPTATGNLPRHQQREGKLNQKTTDFAERYEPTPEERRAREAFLARRKTPRVKVSVSESQQKGVVVDWSLDHPHQNFGHYLLTEALGTSEFDFYTGIMTQLLKAATKIKGQAVVDEPAVNFMISVIKGVQPKDQLESMLAAQMAAVHMLTMDFACRLNIADDLLQQDSAERALNKLARTFAAQLEALKRY